MQQTTPRLNFAKPNLTHTSPSDGEQLGEDATPRRNDLPDDRGVLGEDGAPRDGIDDLGEQAGIGIGIGIGQAGDIGRLVDSVKYLQVRKRLLHYLV